MRKTYLTFIAVLVLTSCSGDKFGYIKKKYGDKEKFGWDLSMLLDHYTATYNRTPRNANDLMTYIERMDKDSRFICEDFYIYDYQYLYLKNNHNKLIFITDSLIYIYYKKVDDENLLIQTSISSPCNSVNISSADFFDNEDLYVSCDTLSSEAVQRLYREYLSYYFKTKDSATKEMIFKKTKIEYTSNSLKDLCGNQILDINQSPLIRNTFNYLDSLAHSNNFSRIIASGLIEI